MARLSRVQDACRREILHLARTDLTPGEFGRRLLAVLDRAVPADGQQLFGVDPGTLLFNRVLAVSPGMAPHTLWYLRNRYLAEPVAELDHPELMRARHTALVLHDRPETSWAAPPHLVSSITGRDWYHTYHECQGPAGGVLRAYFAAGGQGLAGLVLARFEAKHPFQATDVAFIRAVAPLIGRAFRAALDRERAIPAPPSTIAGASGVIILSPDGREQLITPVAEEWLGVLSEWEAGLGTRLPAAVWSAVATLRGQSDLSALRAVRLATPAGPLRIEASVAQDGCVAVVLTPEHRETPPEVPSEWPLTGQERQVLKLALAGLTNRQIAATLVVTEHTVESHIAHAYAKLDVHSRSQMLGRLFREAYWPNLEVSPLKEPANRPRPPSGR